MTEHVDELKGADATWHVPEGFAIQPLYTADDLPADPLAAVRTLSRRLRSPRTAGLPPLTGGLVGWLMAKAGYGVGGSRSTPGDH